MRKILLILISVLCAYVSYGASVKKTPLKRATQKVQQLQTSIIPFGKDAKSVKKLDKAAPAMKTRADEIITEKPEGKDQAYLRSGDYWASTLLGLDNGAQSGYLKTVIADDGQTMYIQDFISSLALDTWVYANISEDGSKVSIPTGQLVYPGYALEWGYFSIDEGWSEVIAEGYDEERTEIVLDVDADGVMTVTGSGMFEDEEGNVSFVGPCLIYEGEFTYYIDYASVYTPSEIPENIPAPEGLELSEYSMLSADGGDLVNVGWDGDDVWIQGFDADFPEAWIKGTKKGDKIVFDTPQFLGFYSSYAIYLMGANYDFELIDLVFDYDEATKSFSLPEGQYMLSNASLERVYYLSLYESPKFAPFTEVAATPATPSIDYYSCYLALDGYDNIELTVPCMDVDGNFINPEKLSYIIYVNGEPYTFANDPVTGAYPYVEEPITELPYAYSDGYDITSRQIYFYETAFSTIGIKSIYYGGGEVHESEVFTFKTDIPDANDFESTGFYTSFDGDEDMTGSIGTGRAETYDVATFVQDYNLIGAKVTGMTILTTPKSKDMLKKSNYSGWISNKLGLEANADGAMVAATDVVGETSLDGNVLTVTFAEPYEITEEGFFAGYSFKVNGYKYDEDIYPVLLAAEPAPNGFFMHTSKSYRSWINLGASYSNAILPVILTFEDGSIKEVGARFFNIGEKYVKGGEATTINVAVANNGTSDIESIDYTLNLDGQDYPMTVTLDQPLSGKYYGQKTEVTVDIPAIEELGEHRVYIVADKVNGKENEVAANSGMGIVNVIAFVPKHRVLVEEYTGTWCGWCTRGYVGMTLLAQNLGEDFVGVAYHNGDPMASLFANDYGFPSPVSGFPSAWLNRNQSVDPYYGSGNADFGIYADVLAAAEEIAPCEVSVNGNYNSETNEVEVSADAKFIVNADGGQYSVEFIAIENGLSGEGADWAQGNYYGNYTADQVGPDLGWLCDAGSSIEGLVFNDVFLLSTYYYGQEEDLPETIEMEQNYTVSASLPVDYMVNSDYEPISQDVNNIEVIAIVVDKVRKAVVNAAKTRITVDGELAISEVNADAQTNAKVYNLQGIEVNKGYKGIVIMNNKKYIAK